MRFALAAPAPFTVGGSLDSTRVLKSPAAAQVTVPERWPTRDHANLNDEARLSLAFAAGVVALWLVIPGVTQLLGVAALFAPAVIVCALALAGWEQVAKLWHGPGDESKVTPPVGPGS